MKASETGEISGVPAGMAIRIPHRAGRSRRFITKKFAVRDLCRPTVLAGPGGQAGRSVIGIGGLWVKQYRKESAAWQKRKKRRHRREVSAAAEREGTRCVRVRAE